MTKNTKINLKFGTLIFFQFFPKTNQSFEGTLRTSEPNISLQLITHLELQRKTDKFSRKTAKNTGFYFFLGICTTNYKRHIFCDSETSNCESVAQIQLEWCYEE